MKPAHRKIEAPRVTVDIVIFTIEEAKLKTLLIKRKFDPFKNIWALPGGFVRSKEDIYAAALRELSEESGISGVYLEQLYTFGSPKRDPRGRVITIAYFALASRQKLRIRSASDAKDAGLFSVDDLPRLAFDHKEILEKALERLGNKIQYTNVLWSLLPEYFTLGDIQRVYEIIWGKKADKRNFRKKLLSLGLLKPIGKLRKGLRRRPARLYQFKTKKYVELKRFF
ncbi:MAG: hypothetical protein A2934_00680 [Candidatus Sungbacteria bacterium RIFCSPLOWO2_01_FULL_47_10]|uniref:Nudix hydrolase domain-containing protein n=1 Tax=Candidatus Sungbacteria bacterium RIFCSPLOWO2_01_FULL_47_10 TaxID=1802276 RepID=A0A1G2L3T6_9BACT|nr:MAG: hypothetical protein A2934_00680 [Candidatus Sungbacteria bacterium RIFCSPLOWO2_01_FULL_47_10]